MRAEIKEGVLEVLLDNEDIAKMDEEKHLISGNVELYLDKLNGNLQYSLRQENGMIKITLQKGIYFTRRVGHKEGEPMSFNFALGEMQKIY